MEGSCAQGNELSHFTKGGECLDHIVKDCTTEFIK
jgi:hypothetical protein